MVGELSYDAEDGYIFEVAIHNIYTTLATTTHSPPSHWRLVVICIHPRSRQSFHRLHLKGNSLLIKVRYVVHYRNLKLYLQLSLVVTRIYRMLTFKQSTWLKTYIDFNTHQRSLAGCSFLMNNSVFGKTQENLRKRVQVELITYAGILRKRVAKPNLCRGHTITDCLPAIQCTVATLTPNRPIHMGFSLLDLSKLHIHFTTITCA